MQPIPKTKQTEKLENELSALEGKLTEAEQSIAAAKQDDDIDAGAKTLVKMRALAEVLESKIQRQKEALRQSRIADALTEIKKAEEHHKQARAAYETGRAKYKAELDKTHEPRVAQQMAKDQKTWPLWLKDIHQARQESSMKIYDCIRAFRALDLAAARKAGFSRIDDPPVKE